MQISWKIKFLHPSFFDGSYSKEGVGASIVLIPLFGDTIALSHKMEFNTTKNIAKYEALILGLETARKMGVKNILVFRNFEIVVQQIKKQY